MAFNKTKFERQSGGLQKVWSYITTDDIATVTGSGYFNLAYSMLDQFDRIHVVSETGGTPKGDWLIVTSASRATTVTTSATEGVEPA